MLPMDMLASLSLPLLPTLCALSATVLAPACESEPQVLQLAGFELERPLVEFGAVFEGRVLEHRWELSLLEPKVIESAKTDCGCTLASLERAGPAGLEPYSFGEPLEVGARLHVTLRYDTRGRLGPAERAVTLNTAAGEALRLSLAADALPWLKVDPAELEFTRVTEGQGAERVLRVSADSGEAFALRGTGEALPPWVTVELEPEGGRSEGRAMGWQVHVRLGAEAPLGTYAYPIELLSDAPIPGVEAGAERRHFSISPIWTLQVVGPVALSAPRIEFGLVRPTETVAQSLLLESFDPDFVPDSVVARLEPIHAGEDFPLGRTATVRTRLAGRACEIEVVLAGLDAGLAGTFLGKLVIETGHPGLPHIEALVHGVGMPGAGGR